MTRDNQGNDDLGSLVGRELHHRVDNLHEAPLTFDDVKGKAGSIRRNRRLAAGGGVLAAIAIIVPVAVFAGQGLGENNTLPPANTSTPTPTKATDTTGPTPAPSPTGDPTPGEVPTVALGGEFASGPPPAVPYLDGKQLIRHDQDPVRLPQAYDTFALLGDRLVGTYQSGNGGRLVDVVEADGTVSTTEEVEGGVAVSDAGTTVAYGTPAGTIETLWADDQVQLANNLGEPASVAAVAGDGSCYEGDGGCRVFFNSTNFGDPPQAADSHGIVDTFMDGALKVDDVSPTGLIAVQTSSSDNGSCSGVYNEQDQDFVFETCDNTLQAFSPDGGRLLAGPAYLDGIGDHSLTVLDTATADSVADFEIDAGFIADAAWEDDDHVLIVVYNDTGWRILRAGFDGSVETVAGPQTTEDDLSRLYYLPAH
jgi:hypothetical protein